MTHDAQRDRLYRAEHSIDQGAQLYTAAQVRRYVGSLAASPWWQAHDWPVPRVHVGRGRNAWGGRLPSGAWFVNLPTWRYDADAGPWAWRELVIVHELTHVAHMADLDGRPFPAPHGADFAGRYVEMTMAILGADAAARLALAFERHHVAVAGRAHPDVEPCGPDALLAAGWQPLAAPGRCATSTIPEQAALASVQHA